MKKVFALVIAIMLVFSTTACNKKNSGPVGDSSNFNKVGLPIVKEPITLKVMTSRGAASSNYDSLLIWKEMEERTGVHVQWIEVPEENAAEKRNIAIASGDMPDVFFKLNFPPRDVEVYGNQGSFVQLNDYIEKYCPNIKAALEKYPEVDKGLKTVEGRIFSLPYIMDVLSPRITSKLFVDQKWLEQLGMQMPTTTEEYYKLLKAMKDNDLNKNGKADEIPLSAPDFPSVIGVLKGAWGLANRGNGGGNFDLDEQTGKVRYWPIDANYKDMLVYLNRLYTEKLLDQEIFTTKVADFTGKASQGLVGTFAAINNNFAGQKYQGDYKGIPAALKGPTGIQQWNGVNSKLWQMGAFTMSATNKNPEATVRWVDYLYSEEGIKLYFVGIEGQTCKLSADGSKYEYTEEITKNPNGLSYDQAMGKYLCWGGFGNPSIAMEKYFAGPAIMPIPLEAANNLSPYIPKDSWTRFAFTQEESEQLNNIEKEITNYVDEMTARFVMGAADFSQWDSYVQKLKDMQLDEVIKIYQTSYDRSKNK